MKSENYKIVACHATKRKFRIYIIFLWKHKNKFTEERVS